MDSFSKQTTRRRVTATCFLLCLVCPPVNGQEPPPIEASPAESIPGEEATGRTGEEPAAEPDVQARIRRALQGFAEENAQQKPGGDPLLEDVLQMLRQRGSVLEGTALDPKLSEPAAPGVTESSVGPKESAAAFRTAESLLRSARLLETLPPQDATRQRLVRRLRSEAARCLRHALSHAPTTPPETR